MREPDFVPRWYPQLRNRQRNLIIEIWVIALLGGALYLWGWQSRLHLGQQQAEITSLDSRLGQTSVQLEKLKDMLDTQRKLKEQEQVVDRLGPYVPTARLIDVLDEAMPSSMALLDLQEDTQETPVVKSASTDAPGGGGAVSPTVDRKVKMTVTAVAPSDVELAAFLANLSKESNLSDISMTYARDFSQDGHIMREFAVTFDIDLGIRAQ
jgi:Tfp pilus assembly protein PilN